MAYDLRKDPFSTVAAVSTTSWSPGRAWIAITPSDVTELSPYVKALWIGGGGNVRVVPIEHTDSEVVNFVGCATGSIVATSARFVHSSGTTATSILGCVR